jgi:hypothetical protein
MSKPFNYPFLTNCRDIIEHFKYKGDPKSKQTVEAASYIVDSIKQ